MRMHEQEYMQSDMDSFDRIALKRKNYVAIREKKDVLCYKDRYKVVQRHQKRDNDTVKAEGPLDTNKLLSHLDDESTLFP